MGVEKELELPEHGLKRTLKDLFAGAVGGVAQVLLGMFTSEISSMAWRLDELLRSLDFGIRVVLDIFASRGGFDSSFVYAANALDSDVG